MNYHVSALIGVPWGDEGKGKIVDLLAKNFNGVVRFQGGANAGHTVVINEKKTILHLIPSGILHPHTYNVMGNGMVIDFLTLKEEMDTLSAAGINFANRFYMSDQAHVIFPWHRIIDTLKSKGSLGTTGRGIGQAYEEKMRRTGIRVGDFSERAYLQERFDAQYASAVAYLQSECNSVEVVLDLLQNKMRDEKTGAHLGRFFSEQCWLDKEKIFKEYVEIAEQLQQYICDTVALLHKALQRGEKILLEGAQGTFLDVDHGMYPFVTSSNTITGGASAGTGLPPQYLTEIWGVFKAYTTRVGHGPFPTEQDNLGGELLRKIGDEYGATTGRPRRCGWFDAVLAKRAVLINGITDVALTKLDVLSYVDRIPVCTAYEKEDGTLLESFPKPYQFQQIKPHYELLPGWKTDVSHCRNFADLPENAQKYVKRIEEITSVPIKIISVGPAREQTIFR